MIKTVSALTTKVSAEAACDPAVNEAAIGVAVKDGIVTLTGHLDTYADKAAATCEVRRVAGIKPVAVEIDNKLVATHERNDTDIATSAEPALKWNTSIPAEAVRITVEDGRVILHGEVEWNFQRHSAERAIRPLMGVVGIRNEIRLRIKPHVADLTLEIEGAWMRQALRDAQQIRGTVMFTLREWQDWLADAWPTLLIVAAAFIRFAASAPPQVQV